MNLGDLSGRRVALLGLGIDVRAAIGPILRSGVDELVVVDSSLEAGRTVEVERHELKVVELQTACDQADVLVRSPGFPRYLAELVAARESGVAMTTPVDLYLGGIEPERRTVLVTGTKGKSTTTDLIGQMAREAGLSVGIAGNLGIPVFQPGWDDDASTIVLEVSSYQAADLHHAPDIAVVPSIAEDHLSWHGGLDRYLHDKLRIVSNDAGVAETVMIPRAEKRAIEVVAQLFPEIEPVLVDDPVSDSGAPLHRLRNAALAARVVEHLGGASLDDETVAVHAKSGMPGRLDVVESPSGFEHITFVDDALASNPSATAAGLAWSLLTHSDTVVILGGDDRGVSSAPLQREAAEWNSTPGHRLRAVTLPRNGEDLAHRCGVEVLAQAESVTDAVEKAVRELDHSGSMVVFSPAAPTPAGHGNWEARSKEFREAVRKLSHP